MLTRASRVDLRGANRPFERVVPNHERPSMLDEGVKVVVDRQLKPRLHQGVH